ncbi:MAG: sigma-70 family RNA polymerase sigma factor [Pseudomonadota bacterium]
MSALSELDEIRAAAAGNRLAQSALVARHTPKVYALARRLVRDEALAEDITQEAFLRMWKVLEGWEPRAKLSTWLYRVTLNLCRDLGRKRRETTVDELPEQIDGNLRPDELAEQKERLTVLQDAIEALPPRQCEALTLCGIEEHTNIEAAEILEISVEALESLLARARRKLRANLLDKHGAVV